MQIFFALFDSLFLTAHLNKLQVNKRLRARYDSVCVLYLSQKRKHYRNVSDKQRVHVLLCSN